MKCRPGFIHRDAPYLVARKANIKWLRRALPGRSLCDAKARDSARQCRFGRINSRATAQAVIECFVTGLLAWRDGQSGQVGNEAATAVFHQCRGSGSSPSFFLFSSAVLPNSCFAAVRVLQSCSSSVFRALHLFFSIDPLACFNEAATRVRAPSRFGFARHRY